MSTNEQTPLSQPTSTVRNTLGKEQAPQDSVRPISDEALREYCDKNYHQILPIIAEKVHQEKVHQAKLKAVKARLNFEEDSQHSESGTSSGRRNLKERLGPRRARSMSGSPELRHGRSKSPRKKDPERGTVFKRLEKGVFHMLGGKEKNVFAHSRDSWHRSYYSSRRDKKSCYQSSRFRETEVASKKHRHKRENSQRTEALSESEGSAGGHWKSKPKKRKSSIEDDLSQPWVCEETDPFTPRIRYFDFPRTRMPSHIKTYDGSEDLEDHLKIFQATAKTERWAMLSCYDDLREVFLENYLQQKKYIKDTLEIHNIKQRDGESTEEFVQRYKLKCRDVNGAPECMKIFAFMHGITIPELIKRLHDKIPKLVDEMMRVTTAFLRGEVSASNREWKKSFPSWKQQDVGQKQNFKKGSFQNQQRMERKQYRFTLLTKTPKEILALDKGKQIEEMLKAKKLSHLIKELKQNNGKDQAKAAKKGEPSGKDKSLSILMVQPWQRVARQRITQTFSPESVISFPPLGEEDETKGPMIIEAEMGGHCVHCMYMDGGSSLEILYEHCFNRFCPEVKNQMVPAATPLVGFSGEIIWPLGQISLLVKIGDEEHTTSSWMNFMVVRSPYPYNGIIGRPGSRRIVPLEFSMVSEPGMPRPVINQVAEEKI
ncbi:reverse transcriptase domain-containing protein [Tanacetum coccineum]|uniref:Reverse transcriptase domain-containing protein n=1 Tax=Tanacetum coccineum TaxID=301880 RepID=A0ABQ4XAI0_9ASTR